MDNCLHYRYQASSAAVSTTFNFGQLLPPRPHHHESLTVSQPFLQPRPHRDWVFILFIMSSSTRRAHMKSRKGCQTCKHRKVRCDEYFPQWSAFLRFFPLHLSLIFSASRNCTKRGLRCAYMDDPAVAENASPASTIGEFAWPSDLELGTNHWQQTKDFPFPHLQLTSPPNPDNLSTEECRLLFHICTLSKNLELSNSARFTTWAHKMPEYAAFHLC